MYVVLGFYRIAHAWGNVFWSPGSLTASSLFSFIAAESQSASNERGRVVRYKFAFQWCESQGEPWWLKKSDVDVALRKNDVLCVLCASIFIFGYGVEAAGQPNTTAASVDSRVAIAPPLRSSPSKSILFILSVS
jgi:hypothetical protein